MENREEKPFADALQAILFDELMPIHLLFRLSDTSPEEWQLFSKRWQEIDGDRRRIIVRHLADISEEDFMADFAPIFSHCLNDAHDQVRLAALDGLWDVSDARLIAPLIDVMQQDDSIAVRASATASLTHYILMSEWGELPRRVAKPIVAALLAAYDDPETAVVVRRATVEALGASSHERVSAIIREVYEDDDPVMQASAVFAMGNSADSKWLPILIDEMDNVDAAIRAEAARAAGAIGKSDAVSELANLTADEDFEVQLVAVEALGKIGGDLAQDVLTDLLADEEKEALHDVANEALEELAWMGSAIDLLDLDFDSFNDEINLN